MAELNFTPSLGIDDFFVEAFSFEMGAIWREVFPERITDLCFRALFTSFKGNDLGDISNRRELLYCLLRGPFSTEYATDPLRQYRKLLPTKNFAAPVCDKLNIAYDEDPKRRFSSNPAVNEYLSTCYKQAEINTEFRWGLSQATLNNIILVRPYFDDERMMHVQTTLPDSFVPVWHPLNPRKMVQLWIAVRNPPADRTKREPVFQVWTDTEVWYADLYGDRVGTSMENRYGRIPFVPLQIERGRSNDNPMGGGLYSLVWTNLMDNAIHWMSQNSAMFTGFQVWVSTNMNWSGGRARLHPGRVVGIDGATQGTATRPLLPPALDMVGGDGSFTLLDDYAMNQKEEEMFELGLPDFMGSRRAGLPTSATEQVLRMASLLERRRRILPGLNNFEGRFAEMVCLVARTDQRELGLPEKLEEFTTDFSEPRIRFDEEKELKHDATLVAVGVLGLGSFAAKWEGLDETPDDDEALKIIADRRAKYAPVLPIIEKLAELAATPAPVVPGANPGAPGRDPEEQISRVEDGAVIE